jgi:hypothetical protein
MDYYRKKALDYWFMSDQAAIVGDRNKEREYGELALSFEAKALQEWEQELI